MGDGAAKIVNFGSMNVDYVYRVDSFLLPGETRPAKSRSVHAGGKVLNQSIAPATQKIGAATSIPSTYEVETVLKEGKI